MPANEVRTRRGANGVRGAPPENSPRKYIFSGERRQLNSRRPTPLNAQRHLDELRISCFHPQSVRFGELTFETAFLIPCDGNHN